MLVVIVTRGLPSRATPLRGIFEWDQARALRDAGHHVVVASLDLRSIRRRRPWGIRHLVRDQIEVFDLNWPVGNVPPRIADGLLKLAWRRAWPDIVALAGRPDVVHAHFLALSHAVATSSLRNGYPLVVTEHWSRLDVDRVDPVLAAMATQTYRTADAVLAVSAAQAERLGRFCTAPIDVVPDVVDVARFVPLVAEREARHRAGGRLVSIGRLDANKHVERIIDAVAALPGTTLTVVGDGALRADLERRAQRLGLGDRVDFRGQQGREQVASALLEADVFVTASGRETFGVAAAEAMAAGLPVVSTPSGGPEGFITPTTGIITDDVTSGVREALGRDWDARRISDDVVSRFSPAAVAADLTAVYRRVTAARGR